MAWTIKGESGVTVTTVAGVTYGLNATTRTFTEMGFSNWTLKFQNLADDFFTYTVATKNAKGLGAIVPRDGQMIEIFYEGVRKFKGHVVKPKLGLKSLTVTVYGPFWWMGKITLSGLFTDATGGSADLPNYAFPTQNLRLSLQALNNRAVTKGVPMAQISDGDRAARISAMFEMLNITLEHMSFAGALAELMSMVADAVAWFDYEPTTPELNITRRDNMSVRNFTVGSTGSTRVESAEIFPRTDQQVRRVDLKYLKRQPLTGLPRWASKTTDAANTAITTQAHKKQWRIITVAGPETLAMVPPSEVDSVSIRTVPKLSLKDVGRLDPVLAEGLKQFPFPSATWRDFSFPEFAGGSVVFGKTKDWMVKDYGLKTQAIQINGWYRYSRNSDWGEDRAPLENFMFKRGLWRPQRMIDNNHWWFQIFLSFPLEVINLAYPKKTTVYKKWDYDFIAPPEDLAADLKGTQDWLPWEGPVVIAKQELDGFNGLSRKVNLANSHPDHADMNSLVKAVTYDGGRHRVTWDLGPPARTDLGRLLSKLRRAPQDNIVRL